MLWNWIQEQSLQQEAQILAEQQTPVIVVVWDQSVQVHAPLHLRTYQYQQVPSSQTDLNVEQP